MKGAIWAWLRDRRYALPGQVERWTRGPDSRDVQRWCATASAHGWATTIGYFQASHAGPDVIEAANLGLIERLAGPPSDVRLSLKVPPLGFDAQRLGRLVDAAAKANRPVILDAHAPADADATFALLDQLHVCHPGTGAVLPARWHRSLDDARRLRDSHAPIRIVKGEWADPVADMADVAAAYVDVARILAGRAASVGVATHDPGLARQAITMLRQAGTPCELELLRGLPRRRMLALARDMGVPIRLYLPFGPGFWPYAIDKALAKPWLLRWMISDMCGR